MKEFGRLAILAATRWAVTGQLDNAEPVVREHLLVAATCPTSVSSDGHLTVASLTVEPQRQQCDAKRAHAGLSAIPGRDPKQTLVDSFGSLKSRPSVSARARGPRE